MKNRFARLVVRTTLAGALVGVGLEAAGSPTLPLPPPKKLRELIAQTAALVEGDVVSINYAYDDTRGPRTVVTLGNLRTRLGRFDGDTVNLSLMGGPLPDGRNLYIPELPRFASSGRYLVFLRNHTWFYSPVLFDYALRLETVGDRAVVIDQEGHAITGVGHGGLRRDHPALFHFEDEMRRPFAPPSLANTEVPRTAMSADRLVTAIEEYARKEGLVVGGGHPPDPDLTRVWNRMPVAADQEVAR